MKQISVIVPIFNVEKYLSKCVNSILAQTYPHLQIILVNDGSTDSSPQICRQFEAIDPRVILVDKKNGGRVSARQAGLLAARGELVGFVDADDWIEQDFIAQMLEAQTRTDADIVAANLYFDFGQASSKKLNRIPTGVYSCEQLIPKLLYAGEFFEYGIQPHLVTKLMKREILNKTQMSVDQRICVGEDAAVVYPSILEAEKIAVTDICGYHYVQRSGGITKTPYANERESLRCLMDHLYRSAAEKGCAKLLNPQLKQCEKYLMLLRQLPVLDQKVLLPYGGIPYHSRVVIYGAGVSGQQIYRYLSHSGLAEIRMWLDQNADYYRKNGLPVSEPRAIEELQGEYDYILIANTEESTAQSIRKYLLGLQAPAEKIRWLSREFLEDTAPAF